MDIAWFSALTAAVAALYHKLGKCEVRERELWRYLWKQSTTTNGSDPPDDMETLKSTLMKNCDEDMDAMEDA